MVHQLYKRNFDNCHRKMTFDFNYLKYFFQHELCVWSLFKNYTKEKFSDAHSGAVSCLKLTRDAKKVISGTPNLDF